MASKWLLLVAVCALSSAGCSSDDDEKKNESGADETGELQASVMIKNSSSPDAGGRTCPTSTGVQWDIGPVTATCSVQKTGAFHASAQGTDRQITPPDGLISLELEGQAAVGGMLTASFNTPKTQTVQSGTPACSVIAVNIIGEGALDIDFTCPLLTASDNATVGCEASGALALSDCGH